VVRSFPKHNHRDTEDTEVAQRKPLGSVGINYLFDFFSDLIH